MTTDQEIRKLRKEVRELTRMVESLLGQKPEGNNLVTVSEFARLAGCSRGTVINRIKAGVYGAERHGKLWYLPAPSRQVH